MRQSGQFRSAAIFAVFLQFFPAQRKYLKLRKQVGKELCPFHFAAHKGLEKGCSNARVAEQPLDGQVAKTRLLTKNETDRKNGSVREREREREKTLRRR